MSPPTMPWESRAMSPACGAGSSSPPTPMPPAAMSPWWSSIIGSTRNIDAKTTPMISAHSMRNGVPPRIWPNLQVLQHVPRDRTGAAHHCRHPEHGRHALRSGDAEEGHQQRRQQQRRDRESRHRVRGTTDHADEVAGHRREEEPGHDHHDRRTEGPKRLSRCSSCRGRRSG